MGGNGGGIGIGGDGSVGVSIPDGRATTSMEFGIGLKWASPTWSFEVMPYFDISFTTNISDGYATIGGGLGLGLGRVIKRFNTGSLSIRPAIRTNYNNMIYGIEAPLGGSSTLEGKGTHFNITGRVDAVYTLLLSGTGLTSWDFFAGPGLKGLIPMTGTIPDQLRGLSILVGAGVMARFQ